jgi:DNA polymerase eta
MSCCAGAVIAQRLRATVAQQLSFTCSAGIAPNKLLAKIGSAKNKPNKQTVVLPRATGSLMQVTHEDLGHS